MDAKHMKGIQRSLRNGNYEETDTGILLPEHKLSIGGVFENEVIRGGESLGVERSHNIVVNQGLNHILSTEFNAGAQVSVWYVGIYEANYTVLSTDTASNIASASTESTAYDEVSRPIWNEAAPSAQSITNSANKATFTINASKTIYGAFLISDNTKSGTSGTLMAGSLFGAPRTVIATDQLLITYTLSIADA